MQVEVFSLCDAATTGDGKLNLLGAFDTIWAKKMPAVHPQCALALRLRFNALEGEAHNVSVKLVDEDGRPLIPAMNGDIKVRFSSEQRTSSANFILNIQGLRVERYGEYSIDLAVDGKAKVSLPLFVRERK
jgi:hypothetical protein